MSIEQRLGIENENLKRLLEQTERERDNFKIMVDANLRVNGRLRTLAIHNGYNPASELNELEYLLNRFDEIKQERDEAVATLEDRIINGDDTDPISASSAYFDLCSDHDIPLGGSLSSFINEIIKQRDEALAYIDNLKTITGCIHPNNDGKGVILSNVDCEKWRKAILIGPPAALAALKAEWQAEAFDYCEKEITDSVNVLLKPHIAGVFSVIRHRAQEEGNGS